MKNIKYGFTIIEVSILLVIFLIVALLVVPLSLDDTVKMRSEVKWRNVQSEFSNIFYAIDSNKDTEDFNFINSFISAMDEQTKKIVKPYRITYQNGTYPSNTYRFNDYKQSFSDAVFSYKLFENSQDNIVGVFMYDVNGQVGPNIWGIDVFGYNIYDNKFEPFCKNESIISQKEDCSKNGTGLCCSNLSLIGGTQN